MTPRRLWIQTVPTQVCERFNSMDHLQQIFTAWYLNKANTRFTSSFVQECDVVLMFPPGTSDSTLMWLLSRLRAGTPGLVAHVRHHSSSDSYGFYLTAPYNV